MISEIYSVSTWFEFSLQVSGLPIRNGIQHASEIASMSLCLLNAVKQFSIRHRPLDKLQLRIGIHSGEKIGVKLINYIL